jgi:hypothetical protein
MHGGHRYNSHLETIILLYINVFKDQCMMKTLIKASFACLLLLFGLGQATADVYSSDQVISHQQFNYDKQQVLSFVGNAQVQQKLIDLGVNPADAQLRIANMTQQEINALNSQLNEAPAGGLVGVVVTVLVVVAVLDLMGLTDVYPFINPI